MPLSAFSAPTRAWFTASFPWPTPVQTRGWAAIATGQDTLLLAPTGSGKTLAAFLWSIDQLVSSPQEGLQVLYVSPMKALVADVQRNLQAPLAGIRAAGEGVPEISVEMRTGDTDAASRRRFLRSAPHILVTTPESLYLLLSSQAREQLRTVRTVIVDEIHALAGNKRGVHLALSLERLAGLCETPPQRVGLSATQRPLAEIAAFLAGADPQGAARPVQIVDASGLPTARISVEVPAERLDAPDPPVTSSLPAGAFPADHQGPWPAIHRRLLELIRAHRSTIIFANSRRLCERLAWRLEELAREAGLPEPFVRAHHGSTSPEERLRVEAMLKAGELPAIVATSSLELGIDMGAVDLVVMVESPGAVSRGLQRVGRAGHQVGGTSEGRILPRFRAELIEVAAVVAGMRAGEVEPTRVPTLCLDVLSQQLVSIGLEGPRPRQELLDLARGAWPYRQLSNEALEAVLDMLSGRIPGPLGGELRPRLIWDRAADTVQARADARAAVMSMPGTIPDRGTYGVFVAGDPATDGDGAARRPARGRRLGELDEEMVYETRKGEVIRLGASTWRVVEIQHDRVLVEPAPGELGKMPFWKGEGPGRPLALGRAMGALVRELDSLSEEEARTLLGDRHGFDDNAANNLLALLADQQEATGTLPTDRALTVERFRDETGDWHIAILGPWGSRLFGPWAVALEAALSPRTSEGGLLPVQLLWTDDGILMRFPDLEPGSSAGLPATDALIPDPEEVEDLVVDQLRHSPVYASRFREAAARSLVLSSRRPGRRTPLWAQRLASQRLQAIAGDHASFPLSLEAHRECLRDHFDLPALVELLAEVRDGRLRVVESRGERPSPMAAGLLMSWTGANMYGVDGSPPERRSPPLDRALLRELIGEQGATPPPDAETLAALEESLRSSRGRSGPDALHDRLRRLGALPFEEDALALLADGRALRLGEQLIAAEDAALYRDALGWALPEGLPASLLTPVPEALLVLLERTFRHRVALSLDQLAAGLGAAPGLLEPALELLRARGRLVPVPWREEGPPRFSHPEVAARVLRGQRARQRAEIVARPAAALARFSLGWHGIGARGALSLEEAVERLEGLPLPASELLGRILPMRVAGFRPEQLDLLGMQGKLLWVGRGRLGSSDGRVLLLRREQVALLPPVSEEEPSPLACAVLDLLERRGACFLVELQAGLAARSEAIAEAIWELVWAGRVSNDSVAPLVGLGSSRARPGGGRWSSLVALRGPPEPTALALARARMLLHRHGVVSADHALAEDLPGGIGGLIPVFDHLEEAGALRRGHVIEGLDGVQRALPLAVAAIQRDEGGRGPVVLAAIDPANPWGLSLPWPASGGEASPRRAAGATVVLHDGEPLLFVDSGGRSLCTFAPLAEAALAKPAVAALAAHLGRYAMSGLRVERVDGHPARAAPAFEALRAAGFGLGREGLVLDARL